jgi:tetratricopeptide (TPR) repeat protein
MLRKLFFFTLSFVLMVTPGLLHGQTGAARSPQSAPKPASQQAMDAMNKGQELLFEKHDVQGSIVSFKKVVELDPGYVHGYLLLGNAYMQARQWADAQAAFEKASRLQPQNPTPLLGMGAALNQQQDWSGALKPLQQSLKLEEAAETHFELARSLMGLEKLQEAELHVRICLEMNKHYALPHVLMGDIYLHLYENVEAALAEYERYLQLDPDGPSAASVKQTIDTLKKLGN